MIQSTTRFALSLVVLQLVALSSNVAAKVSGRLKVSDNHRYLQYDNGQPFFYLRRYGLGTDTPTKP